MENIFRKIPLRDYTEQICKFMDKGNIAHFIITL